MPGNRRVAAVRGIPRSSGVILWKRNTGFSDRRRRRCDPGGGCVEGGERLMISKPVQSIVLLISMVGITFNVQSENLTVDAGETVELCGTHVFDAVHVAEGGVLKVTPYDGTEPTGRLDLRADTIHIGEGGIVDADGSGYRGVPGANGEGEGGGLAGGDDLVIYSGGSGGGYGESGEAGRGLHETTRGGRVVHGSQPWKVDRGSAGGGYVTYDVKEVAPENYHAGGHGGGAVILRAESLILDGLITANGQDASSRNAHGYYGATGGGAGGGVLLIARSITGQGTVSAKGGKAVSNFYRHGGVGGGGGEGTH